ncbi:beta-glucosidase-like glycosyl hydrolase [Streptomyces afghaniensis]|nr:beta-glucosidase-like glycosyl hydrolase [Streptomyces afghaniensis]
MAETAEVRREAAVEAALGKLDLDAKTRLLAGQDMWSLPALPEAGLASLVMSDGPIGVRGVHWSADDPSVALPSPTALAATWDPGLAHRAGVLLAQEARRKGVHVLLAPTVNLHRSPLGGRHFEAYSEDPYLTGRIGAAYVRGVQSGGVGTTVKHFVANDAETDRLTVNNLVGERALRELYLAPFEAIVENAHPWGIMTAYNTVNGTTMTEHHYLVNEVLRGELGFDGINVSDWTAARSTTGALAGGLDIAMPGPRTVYGEALARAVREGEADEAQVDEAVRRVLRLAARVGILEGVEPAVTDLPAPVHGESLAREIARRSFVLVRNDSGALPLKPGRIALIGAAARDARVLGGGSATVFPARTVSPLDGLTAALPDGSLTFALGADPNTEIPVADQGFAVRAVCRDSEGTVLGTRSAAGGHIQWMGDDLPDGVTHDTLATVELTGTFTPRETGTHTFGIKGLGPFRLTVAGTTYFDDVQRPAEDGDPFAAFFGSPVPHARVDLTTGEPVEVSLTYTVPPLGDHPMRTIGFTLAHQDPQRDPEELIAEAAAAAPGPPTRPSSWSPPPTASSRRASTARTCACPAGRTTWSAPSPPPTPTPSWSSTPAPRWRCRGATTSPPCSSPGSPARRAARPSPTCSPAPTSPVAACPPPGAPWPTPRSPRSSRRAANSPTTRTSSSATAPGRSTAAPPPTPSVTAWATPTGPTSRSRSRAPPTGPPRRRSASATPATAPAARSSRSTSPRANPTPPARPAGWPVSRAWTRDPARASRRPSNCRAGPSRSGTRRPCRGRV